MKLKYTLVFSIISFFITTVGFSQGLSDKEIGLDVSKIELKLKKRGYKDQDIAEIISGLRKEYIIVYNDKQKQIQIEFQKQIQKEQLEQLQLEKKATKKIAVATVPLEERNALISLYNAAGGPNWGNTIKNVGTWPVNDSNAVVESYNSLDNTGWYGVTVTDGHVTSLNLKAFFNTIDQTSYKINLNGSIADLSALTQLRYLKLEFNKLSGNLNGLQNLENLETLRLTRSFNVYNEPEQPDLESIIPICNLHNLEVLFLGNCTFATKKVPFEIRGLSNLKTLVLGANFTSGIEEIGYLSNLENLSVTSSCDFSGALPVSFSNLQNLKTITLKANSINDMSVLGSLTGLKQIDLEQNDITTIPGSFANLTNLVFFNLFGNDIESVPVFCSNFPLNYFDVTANKVAKNNIPPLNFSTPTYHYDLFDNVGRFYSGTTLRITNNSFRFVDFENDFSTYKNTISNFEYSNQSKIDTPKTETKTASQSITLTMYEDTNRFTASETFQWFRGFYPYGVAVNPTSLSTNRQLILSNLTSFDAGDYYCVSKHPQITNPSNYSQNLELVREPITLKVLPCATRVVGSLRTSTNNPAVNASTTFSLETVATDLTYKWTFYNSASATNVKDGTQTNATASQSYSTTGSYLVRLEVKENNGCITTFDKIVNVVTNGCVDSYSYNRNGMINSPYPYGDPSGIILNKPTNLSFYSSSGSTSLSYQWGLLDSNNLLVASGNQAIFPITVTNAGDYKVTLRVSDALGCSSFEINLKTRDGNACVIPEYERGGYIINPTNSEKLLVNTATVLSLSRAGSYITTGFTYKWDLIKLNGEVISSGNEEKFSAMPTEIGDYKINLEIKDPNGCTTNYTRDYKVVDICDFTEDEKGYVGASDEYNMGATYFVKINESKEFSVWWGYTDISANATYKWSLFNPSGELISTNTNATFSSVFTIPGYYRVELEITNTITGCKRIATKEVGCLIGNSCTELNPKSAEVKVLLNNFIKSLLIRSVKGETDAQINASPTSPEFLALKPYITKGIGDNIYNYSKKGETSADGYRYIETIDFSFSPDRLSDIHLEIYGGISEYANYGLTDEELSNRLDYDIFIDVSQYISSNDYFISCRVDTGGKNANTAVRPKECRQESEVRYIDFCPTDCIPIEGTLKASTETPIINTSTKFSFGTAATNLTYNWTVTNSSNAVIETVTNTTGLYSFIANTIGNYTINVKVINEKKCETEFSKTITAIVPLPIVDCETHFNFNFKIPYITKGGLLNNIERENIANGIIGFVNKNISEKLYLTTYDDHSSGVRAVAVQNKYTTVFPEATTNTSNETQSGFFRVQDDFYSDSFKNMSAGVTANVAITKKIDVSFFVISEDNFADITASKAAYSNLLNSTKSNKIFFIFLDEGRFRNRTLNTYISPVEFASQVKGSVAINYAATGNILTSDFISFSKAQIADAGFKNILSAFLDKSYTQVKSKKCTTASCVTTNPNSQVVKGLFINLVNKLQSLPAGTVTNGYTCPELTALTPFITVSNPAIYNYNQGSFSFSNLLNNNDVFMGENAQVTDINLDSYVDSETETNFIAKYGTIEKGSSVKHINFCPDKLCSSIEGIFKFAPQVLNANVNASFSLETVATNLTYDWTFYNLDNTTELAKVTTPAASHSYTTAGRYRIVLNVKDDKGCATPFENFVTVLPACSPITGVIKIGSGAITTPTTPIPVPTQIYWYQAVHPLAHTGTDFVVYLDGNGEKQTYTLTRTESGYNAPCTEIRASSILNHAGAIPCVSE